MNILRSNNKPQSYSTLCWLIIILINLCAICWAVDVPEKVCASGAVTNNSVHLYIKGSIGQPLIQNSNSVLLYMKSGFIQGYMAIDNTQCRPGDANNDNYLNILDIIYMINYKYKAGPLPQPDELCSGDANCDCETDIIDIIYLISYKYNSGLPPCGYSNWRPACGN